MEDVIKNTLDGVFLDYSHLEWDEENRTVSFRLGLEHFCTAEAVQLLKEKFGADRVTFMIDTEAEAASACYLQFYVKEVSLNPSKWVFQLEADRLPESDYLRDEEEFGVTYVWIWNTEVGLVDYHIGYDLEEDIPMFKGAEAMESFFEIKGDHDEARAKLKRWGLREVDRHGNEVEESA